MKKLFTLIAVMAMAITTAFAETITLDFSSIAGTATGATPIVDANGFSFVGNNSKVTLTASGFYTGGSSTSKARHAYYTPTSNGTLTVEATPSGDNSDRFIAIADAAKTPKKDGSDVLAYTMMPTKGVRVKVSYDLKANTTYYILLYGNGTITGISYEITGVVKEESKFAITGANSKLLSDGGNFAIQYSGNAGEVTFKSGNEKVATVDAKGNVTALSGGQAVITVVDPGTDKVMGKTLAYTVSVPYSAKDAVSYVLNSDEYGFSYDNKYYFKNGFVISNNNDKAYGVASGTKAIKYSANVPYTIEVPKNVTIYSAKITARNNYTNEDNNKQGFWGTIFGEDLTKEALPWAAEEFAVKTITFAQPANASSTLVFTPTGNQAQIIVELFSSKPVIPVGDEVKAFNDFFTEVATLLGYGEAYEKAASPIVAAYIDGKYEGREQVAKDALADAFMSVFVNTQYEALAKMYVAQVRGEVVPTAISNVAEVAPRAGKYIQNGRVVIVKNGKAYTTTGALVK